ncbi:hypothetical protein BaRGS_00001471 [Batillaria attramentaria]|uniref:Uncharacterized protein n=1 Tax=Batillaria attramentaria TaxID=370345 RepID=A0ABD0M796_9CAEN
MISWPLVNALKVGFGIRRNSKPVSRSDGRATQVPIMSISKLFTLQIAPTQFKSLLSRRKFEIFQVITMRGAPGHGVDRLYSHPNDFTKEVKRTLP